MPRHIVMTVFGSLGDLHPILALALGLKDRGHRVTIAASRLYQEKIEFEGLEFVSLGPDFLDTDQQVFNELFDPRSGPETLIRKYLMPYVRETAQTLRSLLAEADFLINSPTIYAGPVVAESLGLPWASIALQPFLYFSAYDPPVLPQFSLSRYGQNLGPVVWKAFYRLMKQSCADWSQEVYRLQEDLGVSRQGNPLFEGQFSPYLNLALFSPTVGPPQPDWPNNTQVPGFLFYDRMKPDEQELPPAVQKFLECGEPPVIFTLGSSVVKTATSFYDVSIEVVRKLNCRAVFLAGDQKPASMLNDRMLWWDAVDYSALFTHAAAVVHQGGMGTTAQVMRAGKPMLIVPHGFDQPDNAARLSRLGVSRTIYPRQYQVKRVVQELSLLLGNPEYAQKALAMATQIQLEDGLRNACDQVELAMGAPLPI